MANPTDSPSTSGDAERLTDPLDYESHVRLVELCRLRVFEADLACAKLQSEGIDAVLHDQRIALTHPFVFPDVPLMVPQNQVAEAREILARPASAPDDDEIGDDSTHDPADDDYIDEPWRCPKCRRKGVELLPSRGRKALLVFWMIALFLPPCITIGEKLVGTEFTGVLATWPTFFAWLGVVVALGLIMIVIPRQRRCPHCNHVWTRGMD